MTQWLCGAMDDASDYESGDCRFDPRQSRKLFKGSFLTYKVDICKSIILFK